MQVFNKFQLNFWNFCNIVRERYLLKTFEDKQKMFPFENFPKTSLQ